MVKSITISMEEEQSQFIRSYAERTGRTISGIIRISLKKFIEEEKNAGY